MIFAAGSKLPNLVPLFSTDVVPQAGSFLYQVQPIGGHRERCRAARSIAGHVNFLPVPSDGVIVHDGMRVDIEKRLGPVALKMVSGDTDAGRHQSGR
jgi:hypothetical protein